MLIVDTDVMVDLIRQHQPALDWLNSLDDEPLLVPGFVAMELIDGCNNTREIRATRRLLNSHRIVWASEATCDSALSAFTDNRPKYGLGIIDSLVGQMAIALDIPLATFNKKHYTCIPGLQTLQPYER
jgi:predicted nucleic acid-binding protein